MAQGVPGRLRPRIILTFRHYKTCRSSAIRTGRLYSRRNPWYSPSETESTSGHVVLSGLPQKKSPATVRLVVQRLNHYATPWPPVRCSSFLKNTRIKDSCIKIRKNVLDGYYPILQSLHVCTQQLHASMDDT